MGGETPSPANVYITGDTRSFDAAVQTVLERRIREIGIGIAAAHGATAEVSYTHEFAPTINDPDGVAAAQRAGAT